MDELLDGAGGGAGGGASGSRTLQGCALRAVHECFCTVKRGDVPCAHHYEAATAQPLVPHGGSYFNAGMMVLAPSRVVFGHMMRALASMDLSACGFAEQDFLNAYYRGAWAALPWHYNATKTLYACHRLHHNGCVQGLWVLPSIRNLHFTMAKPWDLRDPAHKGFERLNQLWWAAYAEPHSLSRVLLLCCRRTCRRRERPPRRRPESLRRVRSRL